MEGARARARLLQGRGWACVLLVGLLACVCGRARGSESTNLHLYSRQLYVYGKQAQARLSSSKVLLMGDHKAYRECLAKELTKNLALSGVGELGVFHGADEDGSAQELASYAADLNPHVKAQVATSLEIFHPTVVVAVDMELSEASSINDQCRLLGSKFIACSCKGKHGLVFNDFIEHVVTDVDGEKAEPVHLIRTSITSEGLVEAVIADGENIQVGVDDIVAFKFSEKEPLQSEIKGFVVQIQGSHALLVNITEYQPEILEDLFAEKQPIAYVQVKTILTFTHEPLASNIRCPTIAVFDTSENPKRGMQRQLALFACFLASSNNVRRPLKSVKNIVKSKMEEIVFKTSHSARSPAVSQRASELVAPTVFEAAFEEFFGHDSEELTFEKTFDSACPCASAVVGAIAAQECIKACTNVFTPLSQLALISFAGAIAPASESVHDLNGDSSDQLRMKLIYGHEISHELAKLKVFVVGAGAIGSEVLKNLAVMNVGLSAFGGKVIVTDMDSIELSNLSRQLLFRRKDIGCSKSVTAAKAIAKLNPHMRVIALEHKVAPETEHIFNDDLWEDLDVVITGLDNVEARAYVDSLCIRHHKPMLDSGTLGTKGNVQVIIPGCTESYGSTSDPVDDSIPVCTIKSFPYKPEHTILWAKEIFEDYFSTPARLIERLLACKHAGVKEQQLDDQELESCLQELTQEDEAVQERLCYTILHRLKALQCSSPSEIAKACVDEAVDIFNRLYRQEPLNLLDKHPLDSVDDDGEPFWNIQRRPPSSINIDMSDQMHLSFVRYAAHIIMSSILGTVEPGVVDTSIQEAVAAAAEDQKSGSNSTSVGTNMDLQDFQAPIKVALEGAPPSSHVTAPEFDKDDVTMHHVDFVTAAANLRGRNFDIPVVDVLQVRQISGKIVPAIATTTALVAGLVCMELVKIAARSPMDAFMNSFANLATPMLAGSEPVAAEPLHVLTTDETFTLWDFVQAPDTADRLTIRGLERFISKRFHVTVSAITYEDMLVHASFLPTAEDVRKLTLINAVEQAYMKENEEGEENSLKTISGSASDNLSTRRFIDLQVICEHSGSEESSDRGMDDEDQVLQIQIPPIRVWLKHMPENRESAGGFRARTHRFSQSAKRWLRWALGDE